MPSQNHFPIWMSILLGFGVPICFGADRTGKLTSALEVRSLPFAKAEAGQPVEVVGTVIFRDTPSTIFIQDETAGTFFRLDGAQPPKPGDRVKVQGRTFPGLYLPGIENVTFQILEHEGLPEPRQVTYEELASGKFHYQYVSIEGIVRSVEPEGENAGSLKISTGSRILAIRIDEPELPNLIGANVRVTGLAAGEINSRRQLVNPYIRVRKWQSVEVIKSALPRDEIPLVTARELLTFKVEKSEANLVRMSGQIIAIIGNKLYLQADNLAFTADLQSLNHDLKISNQVDIIGFPEMRGFRAVVANSQVTNHQLDEAQPKRNVITWDKLSSGDWDSNLVSFAAELDHWYRTDSATYMAVTPLGSDTSIQVKIPELLNDLRIGSELQVSGICLVETTRNSKYRALPDSIIIQARSQNDIQILKAPPWWTARRLGAALIGLATLTLLSGLWIYLLRKRVEYQSKELTEKAALEERQRIAREFHDTLEQDLAGLSLRLDAAAAQISDSKIKGFITGSRSLVARIQGETRSLVADLRETRTKLADLNHALEELANTDEVGPKIILQLDEQVPMLPSRIVHHFKMMTQEAVTNAIKHAEANNIGVLTEFAESKLTIAISDDGKGFEPDRETLGKSGHFGCMGMRERARKVGAIIEWKSNHYGTTVAIIWQEQDE